MEVCHELIPSPSFPHAYSHRYAFPYTVASFPGVQLLTNRILGAVLCNSPSSFFFILRHFLRITKRISPFPPKSSSPFLLLFEKHAQSLPFSVRNSVTFFHPPSNCQHEPDRTVVETALFFYVFLSFFFFFFLFFVCGFFRFFFFFFFFGCFFFFFFGDA